MAAVPSPQPLAVGEANHNNSTGESSQNHKESDPQQTTNQSYAEKILPKLSGSSKIDLCPVSFDLGVPVIQFTMEEVNNFIREEGLHQAVVIKLSYGRPDLQEVRRIFSSQFDIQGHCNVGQLEHRHLLIRFDLFNDYVHFISKTTGFLKSKGDQYFFRTFPWTLGFNPKEETSMAVVWISLPGLPPNFFAKRSLMSIASVVGKALAVDKATQDRTRPSAARVKVVIDLLDKHPNKVKLQVVDRVTGKSVEFHQDIVYDNLPKYCTNCKHQGHDEKACRIKKEKAGTEVAEEASADTNLSVKTALARISNDVNPTVEVNVKLATAAENLSAGNITKNSANHVEVDVELGSEAIATGYKTVCAEASAQVTNEEEVMAVQDASVDRQQGSDDLSKDADATGVRDAVQGKQFDASGRFGSADAYCRQQQQPAEQKKNATVASAASLLENVNRTGESSQLKPNRGAPGQAGQSENCADDQRGWSHITRSPSKRKSQSALEDRALNKQNTPVGKNMNIASKNVSNPFDVLLNAEKKIATKDDANLEKERDSMAKAGALTDATNRGELTMPFKATGQGKLGQSAGAKDVQLDSKKYAVTAGEFQYNNNQGSLGQSSSTKFAQLVPESEVQKLTSKGTGLNAATEETEKLDVTVPLNVTSDGSTQAGKGTLERAAGDEVIAGEDREFEGPVVSGDGPNHSVSNGIVQAAFVTARKTARTTPKKHGRSSTSSFAATRETLSNSWADQAEGELQQLQHNEAVMLNDEHTHKSSNVSSSKPHQFVATKESAKAGHQRDLSSEMFANSVATDNDRSDASTTSLNYKADLAVYKHVAATKTAPTKPSVALLYKAKPFASDGNRVATVTMADQKAVTMAKQENQKNELFNCANLKREQENRLKLRFQFASHRVERVIKDELQIPFFEHTLTGKLKNKLEAPDFLPSKPLCRTCIHHLDTPPNTVKAHTGTSEAGAIWMKIATWSDKKAIVRRPPMRATEQKQAAPTSATRYNRSKNKK